MHFICIKYIYSRQQSLYTTIDITPEVVISNIINARLLILKITQNFYQKKLDLTILTINKFQCRYWKINHWSKYNIWNWNINHWGKIQCTKCGFLTTLKMSMVFQVVTTWRLVDGYQRFGCTYYPHLQPRGWRQYICPKRRYLHATPQGDITQYTFINTLCKTKEIMGR